MNIVVKHSSRFKPYKLKEPINWALDPYKNKNWLHHFNSLRWLKNEKIKNIIEILKSFHHYHLVKKNKNPYYNHLRGDHTAAIRLGMLFYLKDKIEFFDEQQVDVCEKLIYSEIMNLQNENMYRKGHNHALMVDIALLEVYEKRLDYRKLIDLKVLLNRSAETLGLMWDGAGLTREHSVSYQEYNLPITINYLKKVDAMELENFECPVELNSIISESRRFLGFSLRSNNQYFPIGDSFRSPNVKILNDVFGDSKVLQNPKQLLEPYSTKMGVYYNDSYFIYRGKVSSKDVHFAVTCCWNSANHKKNDELSFCMDINGVVIFDCPGWSAFSNRSVNEFLGTEYASSTIIPLGLSYSNKRKVDSCDSISKIEYVSEEKKYCRAKHQRINGMEVVRTFEIKETKLSIVDSIKTNVVDPCFVLSRIILGKDIDLEIVSSNIALITKGGESIVKLIFKSDADGFIMKGSSMVISSDKYKLENVDTVDYYRHGFKDVSLDIEVL